MNFDVTIILIPSGAAPEDSVPEAHIETLCVPRADIESGEERLLKIALACWDNAASDMAANKKDVI